MFLAFSGRALAWAYHGHEIIGSIADHLLDENARQHVHDILGFDLKTAGPWADCARSVMRLPDGTFKYAPSEQKYRIPCPLFETPAEMARMEDYISRNWSNCFYEANHGCDEAYHFADVAIQHDGYSRSYVGTSDHDIVSTIDAAIMVLQDEPAPLPFSIRDKKEALFLLAHFIGDLHQPLHVGAIYLDPSGKRVNPDQDGLDPAIETAGANFIIDPDGRDQDGNPNPNLHYEWDELPDGLGEDASPELLAKARAVMPTPGPLENFAAIWASDTVMASHVAFGGLKFIGTGPGKWNVQFVDRKAYWARMKSDVMPDQLAKGGARLAQLLNAIWPSPAPAGGVTKPAPASDAAKPAPSGDATKPAPAGGETKPAPAADATKAAPTGDGKVTACSKINLCYCITTANRQAIAANVARVRQRTADQRAAGKMIGYLSVPLSTAGGGYYGVNSDVAEQIKERLQRRFGSGSAWILNPGAEGSLPAGASDADYMYMWTQVLEGRGGFGEDFDFFYFTGPGDFARFFGLTGRDDAKRIDAYFDQRLATDQDLMKLMAAHKLSKQGFRNYYVLRASVAFSKGSHDEWNIARLLNERRRASSEFGILNQIAILFDGRSVTPGGFEEPVAGGNKGSCK